jgi:hypothetical protein
LALLKKRASASRIDPKAFGARVDLDAYAAYLRAYTFHTRVEGADLDYIQLVVKGAYAQLRAYAADLRKEIPTGPYKPSGWDDIMRCLEKEKWLAAAHKEFAKQIKNGI